MVLIIFFAIVCVLEVILLIGLGFAYWGLVQADKKITKARNLVWEIRVLAAKKLRTGEIGVLMLSNGLKAAGLFLPWWIRAFMLSFKWASKMRSTQTT